ncbi:MAG: TIGR00297 family protein [Cyanobacteria bacterium QS_8_64_29]|nr:MAG: TIGR00297 family protein [Cyanobacteria bacterium QS_8_64_29]
MVEPWLIGGLLTAVLLLPVAIAPVRLLTRAGLVHAWGLGTLVWGSLGWPGFAIVAFYFLAGSALTRLGMARKQAAGLAERRAGARGPENVWGSALTGAACALATLAAPAPQSALFVLGYAASFSTKLADTTASEVGKAYGRRTFSPATLRPVPPGTEGAVSWEGTLAGAVASAVLALVAWATGAIAAVGVGWCVAAALVATTLESAIGATLQQRWAWLTNEAVNVAHTAIGAAMAMALAGLAGGGGAS